MNPSSISYYRYHPKGQELPEGSEIVSRFEGSHHERYSVLVKCAEETMAELVDNVSVKHPASLATMLDAVAAEFRVSTQALRSESRSRFLARPRQVYCWLGRQAGKSSTQIAQLINRHHTTVLYGAVVIQLAIGAEPIFAARVKSLANKLGVQTFHRPYLSRFLRHRRGVKVK